MRKTSPSVNSARLTFSAPVTMQHIASESSGVMWERLSRAVTHPAATAVIRFSSSLGARRRSPVMPSMIRTSIRPPVDFPAPWGPVRNGAGTGTVGPRQPMSQAMARHSVSAVAKLHSRISRSMPLPFVSLAGRGSSPVSWVRRQLTSCGSGVRMSHPVGWMRTDCPSARPRSNHVAPSDPGATRMCTGCTSSVSASASIRSSASFMAVPLKTPTPSRNSPTMSSWRWLPVVPWERMGRATGWPLRCA